MALKIKWNDDRVRGATTAILLIGRDRLARGRKEDLIRASLAEYRADPEGYKLSRKTWPDARELGPLGTEPAGGDGHAEGMAPEGRLKRAPTGQRRSKPSRVAYYRDLIVRIDRLTEKWTQAKRQFNSLLELDNALIEQLEG